MKMIYVEWFDSPAQLSRFLYLNKIKPKNIVSILIENNKHELWFYGNGKHKHREEKE